MLILYYLADSELILTPKPYPDIGGGDLGCNLLLLLLLLLFLLLFPPMQVFLPMLISKLVMFANTLLFLLDDCCKNADLLEFEKKSLLMEL